MSSSKPFSQSQTPSHSPLCIKHLLSSTFSSPHFKWVGGHLWSSKRPYLFLQYFIKKSPLQTVGSSSALLEQSAWPSHTFDWWMHWWLVGKETLEGVIKLQEKPLNTSLSLWWAFEEENWGFQQAWMTHSKKFYGKKSYSNTTHPIHLDSRLWSRTLCSLEYTWRKAKGTGKCWRDRLKMFKGLIWKGKRDLPLEQFASSLKSIGQSTLASHFWVGL